jgi:signal transduction histidine kinase
MEQERGVGDIFILLVGSLGMVLLAGAVFFSFITFYRRNLRAKKVLAELEKKHQQDIIYANIQTLEDERKRFAEDLHDDIGASLSAIRLHVSGLESGHGDAEVKDKLTELKSILDHSMASTRRISHNMLPPGLDMMGLAHVVQDFRSQIPASGGPAIAIDAAENLPRLPYNTELILYRILQELLNNTIKHANANHVTITVHATGDAYLVSYTDDGVGFDSVKMQYKGLGLANLKSRAAMINGELVYVTAPGNGINVRITVPLHRAGTKQDD